MLQRRRIHLGLGFAIPIAVLFLLSPSAVEAAVPLFQPAEPIVPPEHLEEERWQPVRVSHSAITSAFEGGDLVIDLFDGERITVRHRRTVDNISGSRSWIGDVSQPNGLVVLVHRESITVGSIRVDGAVFMLVAGSHADGGSVDAGDRVHVLYEVDETLPKYQELEPTPAVVTSEIRDAARQRAEALALAGIPEDDGSVQDLMVAYTERARTNAGGQVAIENVIDLGVTETNLSYETSGIDHRIRLVHTMWTDYDEMGGLGCPRDLLQNPSDGVMDDVHPARERVAADLVKLITDGNGCGRAFIMNEISTDHAAFAFCYTDLDCVSPGYTFQHELGHIQAGRHQRTAPQPDSPFTFNFGFTDPENQFRTIMAAGDSECPDGCPRRLAWSNPDVLDAESGAPMGIPESEELPADNRKTLNETAWVVANFRASGGPVFSDGFESGGLGAWSELAGAP